MALEGRLNVAVDGDAEFALTVTNADTEPVDLTFRSGLIADFAVFDEEDDAEVWRFSDGRMFTQAVETETLAPGESFSRSATWEDPPSGEYTVEATLDAVDVPLTKRTAFSV